MDVFFTLACLYLLIGVRIQLLQIYTNRQLRELDPVAMKLAKAGKPWQHLFASKNLIYQRRNVFDLTKWTYEDFAKETQRG